MIMIMIKNDNHDDDDNTDNDNNKDDNDKDDNDTLSLCITHVHRPTLSFLFESNSFTLFRLFDNLSTLYIYIYSILVTVNYKCN